MTMKTLKNLAKEFDELATEQAKVDHLDANAAEIKFLAHVHGRAALIAKLPLCGTALEDLIKEASLEMELLTSKWLVLYDHHDPRTDVANIFVPDGPRAFDVLPWPISKDLLPIALEILDRNHAVTRIASKTAIVDTSDDELPMMTIEAFGQFNAHRRIMVDPEKGKTVPLTTIWHQHPARKTRGGVVCDFATIGDVGHKLNIFRGFPVQADANKSCAKFLAFIHDVICAGNDHYYRYVVAWLADIVQNPNRKSGVCLVLRSDAEGTGKSFFGKMIAQLFGRHAYIANSPKELLGSFNAHMASCLFCVCNEVLWGGDHASADALKAKITEDVIGLERKGFDTIQIRNSTRYVLTSNNTLPVAAGEHSRRYFILDVSGVHKGDTNYFAELDAEMNQQGGLSALMHLLSTYDLSSDAPHMEGIDLWRAPLTKARTAVAINAASLVDQFVAHIIATGGFEFEFDCRFDLHEAAPTRFRKSVLIDAAQRFTKGQFRGSLETAVTKALKALECGIRADLKTDDASGRRVPAYDLPPLAILREALVKRWGEGVLENVGFEGVSLDVTVTETELPPSAAGLRESWQRQRNIKVSLSAFRQRLIDREHDRAENDQAIKESATEWLMRQAKLKGGSTAVH